MLDLTAPEATVPTPSMEEVAALVGGVPMECEVNAIHPCTTRHPMPANFILVWAECNCDPTDPDAHFTTPACGVDTKEFLVQLRKTKWLMCPGCGLIFKPAALAIKECLPV